MSAPQLDILALEPYYGGARRSMLETLVRCSRHRWTVLKLPPRRMERRLSVAANWFAEQLSRHWVGHVDLLFTSEAMNLASLFQLMPPLARKPSVVYFHENQLPHVDTNTDAPLDLVNLNTANAATEIWFNSDWHKRTFVQRAAALVNRHPELMGHQSLNGIHRKASTMPPPVDLSAVSEASHSGIERDSTALFVETAGGELDVFNKALSILRKRKEHFRLITVGPADGLSDGEENTARTLAESDDAGQARGMCEAGVFVSIKADAPSDFLAIRSLAAGCKPVLPTSGFYSELLSPAHQRSSLYELAPEPLANCLSDALCPFDTVDRPEESDGHSLAAFDAKSVCRQFDERFEELAWVRSVD